MKQRPKRTSPQGAFFCLTTHWGRVLDRHLPGPAEGLQTNANPQALGVGPSFLQFSLTQLLAKFQLGHWLFIVPYAPTLISIVQVIDGDLTSGFQLAAFLDELTNQVDFPDDTPLRLF